MEYLSFEMFVCFGHPLIDAGNSLCIFGPGVYACVCVCVHSKTSCWTAEFNSDVSELLGQVMKVSDSLNAQNLFGWICWELHQFGNMERSAIFIIAINLQMLSAIYFFEIILKCEIFVLNQECPNMCIWRQQEIFILRILIHVD